MTRTLFRFTLSSVVCCMVMVAQAAAQDFQKSYKLGAGGGLRVGNISGDVTVKGYDGDAIVVTAVKKGRDLEMVEIEDRSTANRVDVTVRYPENCRRCDVSVDFQVQVPRSVSYELDKISSVSGEVEVEGVSGKVHASSVSGGVRIKDVTGSVSASSVSGSVEVEIERLEGADSMRFSSVSGTVNVKVPSSLDADVEMSSLSGSLKTDFPLEIKEKKYGPGVSARGRVGSGSRTLKMSSVSGSVNLIH